MNQRKFVLSWGRKMFFGLSLPVSYLVGLVYLRSFILPQNTEEWVYFFTTFIGQFGLLNAVAYFLLFCPIILLAPSYYVSRIWSMILMIALNLAILMDSLSFSTFHLHLYSYIWKPLVDNGFSNLFSSAAATILLTIACLTFAVVIWFRGEILWRKMQTRFSNPVKNWYLVMIVIGLLISKFGLHEKVSTSLAAVFPLNKESIRPIDHHKDTRKIAYPASELNCSGKSNPNLVFILVDEWNRDQFSAEEMPLSFHMKNHGISFTSHYNVASDVEGGKFSLFYSLPASYQPSASKSGPAMFGVMKKRNYDISSFSTSADPDTYQGFKTWITSRTGEVMNPFFLSLEFKQGGASVDAYIQEVVKDLQKADMLKNTFIVITGAHSSGDYLPLLWVNPDRRGGEVGHPTTVYDVVPTLMQRLWNCKNSFKVSSTGQLLDNVERDWILVTGNEEFKVIDLKNRGLLTVKDRFIKEEGSPRQKLLFPALKMMTEFYRSR